MKEISKELYKQYLKQEISELEELQHDGNMMHAIYIIDDIIVGGDFYDGIRSNDHNCLLEIDYSDYSQYIYYNGERYTITWDDVLSWGVVIVPESQTYISDDIVVELDDLGYERLPLNNNHIVGFKKYNVSLSEDKLHLIDDIIPLILEEKVTFAKFYKAVIEMAEHQKGLIEFHKSINALQLAEIVFRNKMGQI